jgi:hypothetical protein
MSFALRCERKRVVASFVNELDDFVFFRVHVDAMGSWPFWTGKRVKSFVASCWRLLERYLTRSASDEIHYAELLTTSDA